MVLKNYKRNMGKMWYYNGKYYNKKEDTNELWQKLNDVKREIGHLNISDTVLRRIKKYGKKIKDITEKEKKNIKHFSKIKMVFILLKSLHVI